jgi:hypothetical protein
VHVGSSAVVMYLWWLVDWLSLDEFSCSCGGRWLIGVYGGSLASVVVVGGVVVVVVRVLAVVGRIYWNLCLVCMCEMWREIGKSEVKVNCESSGAKIDPESFILNFHIRLVE